MKKVYISGKISGLPLDKAMSKFIIAKNHLSRLGHEGINPMEIPCNNPNGIWAEYMMADLAVLKDCDAIMMLPCWEDSKGAQCEKIFAEGCGIEILYYDEILINEQV